MKKIIFAASLLATTFFTAKAQDASTTTASTDGYKPVSGDVTAEVGLSAGAGLFPTIGLYESGRGYGNFNDSDDADAQNLPSGLIRVRYFLADDLAIRVGLNLQRRSFKNETPNVTVTPSTPPATPITTTEAKFRESSTVLNLGIEKHFSGTERLSTYIGADFLFASTGNKVEAENLSDPEDGIATKGASYESKNVGAASGFGLRAIAGADYYIAKKVYLGIELGWGFLFLKEKDAEVKVKEDNEPGTVTVTTKVKGDTGFDLSAGALGAFRLGFRF